VRSKCIALILVVFIGCLTVSQVYAQSTTISLEQKQSIFKALVSAEDQGSTEPSVYQIIAKRYGITARQAEQIADEGISNMWPTN